MTTWAGLSQHGAIETSHPIVNHQTVLAQGVAILRDPYTSTAYTMTGTRLMAVTKPLPAHPANQGTNHG